MVDFRKLILSLAVVALLVGFAVPASAQFPALNCVANSGVPPLLRAEGLAEYVGDVLITCEGGNPAEPRLFNVDIFLNTNITSDVFSTSTSADAEGMILIDEPAPGTQIQCEPGDLALEVGGCNYYLARRNPGFENRLTWNGVHIRPPGTPGVQRIFRITNVRANATQLPTGQFIPSSVSMFINISPANALPLGNPSQVVGTILPSLLVTLGPASIKQCEEPDEFFTVTVREQFASAFKKRIETDTDPFGAPIRQNVPGLIYGTESGFTPDTAIVTNRADPTNLGAIGVADTGTRFVIRLSGVPSGVTITAPDRVASTTTANYWVARVTGYGTDFSGGSPVTTTASASVSLSAGAGTVVYEVIGEPGVNGIALFDEFPIQFPISVPTGEIPGLGDATAVVSYGPLNEVATMSTTAPEPRFTDRDAEEEEIFSVAACRTLILWPFTSNQAGFDTGIAVSNTSEDPFGTPNQSGPCTFYYYGNANGGAAPAPQTSASIPAGEHLVATLSSGGNFDMDAVPGFQGYIIAVCDFQYAHAYGFISDLGAQRLAQGYLALIIPDKVDLRPAEAFSFGAATNDGEQLVH